MTRVRRNSALICQLRMYRTAWELLSGMACTLGTVGACTPARAIRQCCRTASAPPLQGSERCVIILVETLSMELGTRARPPRKRSSSVTVPWCEVTEVSGSRGMGGDGSSGESRIATRPPCHCPRTHTSDADRHPQMHKVMPLRTWAPCVSQLNRSGEPIPAQCERSHMPYPVKSLAVRHD